MFFFWVGFYLIEFIRFQLSTYIELLFGMFGNYLQYYNLLLHFNYNNNLCIYNVCNSKIFPFFKFKTKFLIFFSKIAKETVCRMTFPALVENKILEGSGKILRILVSVSKRNMLRTTTPNPKQYANSNIKKYDHLQNDAHKSRFHLTDETYHR